MFTLALTTALLLTLCACASGGAAGLAREIQSEYSDVSAFTMTVSLAADYGDRAYEFRLKYSGGASGGEIEVLEPECVAGVGVLVSREEGASLLCEGIRLYTGELWADGLTPVDALPALIGAWQTGYVTEAARESVDGRGAVAFSTEITQSAAARTWFDTDTSLPLRAEISADGVCVITCIFENVVIG